MRVCPECGKKYFQGERYCAADGAETDEVADSGDPRSLVGAVLGSYRILSLLGEGGMGMVYKAEHKAIGRQVALKVLHDEFAHRRDIVDRFFTEAKAVNKIRHENIIEITDYDTTESGKSYFVMELLEGSALSDAIQLEGPLELGRAAHIGAQIADALTAAHGSGIIHRDLKPENVFLITRAGLRDFVKLLDFGIAKLTGDGPGVSKTRTGMIIGTPSYMSPEQAEGAKIDVRTDMYAWGIILYEMVCGRVPFVGENFSKILLAHISTDPPKPTEFRPDLPIPLEAVILKCLQKDRADRYESMPEARAALEAAVGGQLQAHVATMPRATSSVTPVPGALGSGPVSGASGPTTTPSQPGGTSLPPTQDSIAPGEAMATVAPAKGGRGKMIAIALVLILLFGAVGVSGALYASGNLDEVLIAAGIVEPPPPRGHPRGPRGDDDGDDDDDSTGDDDDDSTGDDDDDSTGDDDDDGVIVAGTDAGPAIVGGDDDDDIEIPLIADMAKIDGGDFIHGAPKGKEVTPYDGPAFDDRVESFYIDKYEVSHAEYFRYFEAVPTAPVPAGWVDGGPKPGEEHFPVVGLSWDEATTFCEWRGARLPTEAEWEYAAKSGSDNNLYPWGSKFDGIKVNAKTRRRGGFPMEVESLPEGATPSGIHHLAGNVWEWTASTVEVYPDSDPKKAHKVAAEMRAVRGGSYDSKEPNLRTTFRNAVHKNTRNKFLGFRCARDD